MIEVAGGIILAFFILAFLPAIVAVASVLLCIAAGLVALGALWYVLFVQMPNATAEEMAVGAFMVALAAFIFWLNYRDAKQKRHEEAAEQKPEQRQRDSRGRFLKKEVV